MNELRNIRYTSLQGILNRLQNFQVVRLFIVQLKTCMILGILSIRHLIILTWVVWLNLSLLVQVKPGSMEKDVTIIGISIQDLRTVIKEVVNDCLKDHAKLIKPNIEKPISSYQVLKFLGISRPTLNKYINAGLIRRHTLGERKRFSSNRS